MRKYYNMKVAGLDRALPLCPLNDEIAIAGFVIFGDPELTMTRSPLPALSFSETPS